MAFRFAYDRDERMNTVVIDHAASIAKAVPASLMD